MRACIWKCIGERYRFTSRAIPVMTSRGSMTLPRDLLIFLPWASLTTACRYTWKGKDVSSFNTTGWCVCLMCFRFAQPLRRAACQLVWGPSSPYERPRRTGCHGPFPTRCQGRKHSSPLSEEKKKNKKQIYSQKERENGTIPELENWYTAGDNLLPH